MIAVGVDPVEVIVIIVVDVGVKVRAKASYKFLKRYDIAFTVQGLINVLYYH